MKAFLAYRHPESVIPIYLAGRAQEISAFDFLNKGEGFVFHAFDNEKNLFLDQLNTIEQESFDFFYHPHEHEIISKQAYLETCSTIIEKIRTSPIQKIVFSRIQKERYHRNPLAIFKSLNESYPNSFNYIISIENVGTWVGATPEQFLKKDHQKLTTVSLAGTKLDPATPWGTKEIVEQQIVSDFIAEQLKKNQCENTEINGPSTINTGVVSHLKTIFNTTIKNSYTGQIIKDLHPTPATCGLPKNEALKEIQHFEQHKRRYYTGFLGLVNSNQLDLFVNLRCMEIDANYAYLYLGGGITCDSDPALEWHETLHKAKTLDHFLR
ncbi:hypothetical protein DNU06_14605 [Putridiphycobacter roseus]|uniref:Chorismate-utilising enzyme C-terminal domain-containing protein n=1 Tax=Putridiphycobacter roseus TaxID=2219161 RepID=A0A2W1MYB6_9FLAO|nr:chorismate-binding protein [Putridiphycobacter roseus]PZE16190.1 hypothetical protein DNU06_14605 [Putridiphycobacter roseus]